MKYVCREDCGEFEADRFYEIDKPSQVTRMAIRMGYLVAVSGWCAPSETIYSQVNDMGQVILPTVQAEQPEKPRKARKKAVQPETLESIAEAASQALDGLRGPSGI